ncbi:hypothetical protein [uncultured Tateyamaria sp.]|nr:hypothetical protein [uncultured Tateyamaria sp.]
MRWFIVFLSLVACLMPWRLGLAEGKGLVPTPVAVDVSVLGVSPRPSVP